MHINAMPKMVDFVDQTTRERSCSFTGLDLIEIDPCHVIAVLVMALGAIFTRTINQVLRKHANRAAGSTFGSP